jgi:hypothetical protein
MAAAVRSRVVALAHMTNLDGGESFLTPQSSEVTEEMTQFESNRITRFALQGNLGTDGDLVGAVPAGPITCAPVASTLAGAAAVLVVTYGMVESGRNDLRETHVDGSRIGHGSLDQLIYARSVELAG